jgi:hypothetical protein
VAAAAYYFCVGALRLWDNIVLLSTLPLLDWLWKLMTLENKIFIHAIGDFLHILRPLYWSRETSKWQTLYRQQSYSIWKAWFMSLLMDLNQTNCCCMRIALVWIIPTQSGYTAR